MDFPDAYNDKLANAFDSFQLKLGKSLNSPLYKDAVLYAHWPIAT